jgi:hypothetical protein
LAVLRLAHPVQQFFDAPHIACAAPVADVVDKEVEADLMIDRPAKFAHFGPHLPIFGNLLCAKREQDAEHNDSDLPREDAPAMQRMR